MAKIIKTCFDRRPPPKSLPERLALVKDARWGVDDLTSVRFLDGDPSLQQKVERFAMEWTQHAAVNLVFGNAANAAIRVSFTPGGSWSNIGTDCRRVPDPQPTMNYGWLTPESPDEEIARVVLHEFGHALGCIHEHQNPAGGIRWNKEVVYASYAGSPNFWTREQVDHNIFATYDEDVTSHTAVDPQSIMMYPIPPEFTEDRFSVGLNTTLSATDKAFIRQLYPPQG